MLSSPPHETIPFRSHNILFDNSVAQDLITMGDVSNKISSPPETNCLHKAGLSSQVLLPSDAEYATREDSYWTNNAKLGPACIVRPRSAEEVSMALKALVAAGQKFAVRSGGHMTWAGASNIAAGVTV